VEDGYLDLDPDQSTNLYEVFTGTKPAALAIRQTKVGIDVLTSHVLMAAIEQALEPGDEGKLLELIRPLKAYYDFILIDNPPGKAVWAFNGLAAADLILIPASAERSQRHATNNNMKPMTTNSVNTQRSDPAISTSLALRSG
jgi:cellulose biosynthesis protein BcsQ